MKYSVGDKLKKQYLIPKIIHYCWFGRGEKPAMVHTCIESWRKFLPEYQIIEWNETNFDVGNSIIYVQDAYQCKKYAFVSDYVRLYALRKWGGIYMDTDVEVLKSYNDLLAYSSFWGFEDDHYMASCVIGAQENDILVDAFFHHYDNKKFINADGSMNQLTNTYVLSELVESMGITLNGKQQNINDGIVIFPKTYFSPYDYKNGNDFICEESYAIHHFSQTWLPWYVRSKRILKIKIMKVFGKNRIEQLISLIKT